MDKRPPLIVEIERTSFGCIVTNVLGMEGREPKGANKIQIQLPPSLPIELKEETPPVTYQQHNIYPPLNPNPEQPPAKEETIIKPILEPEIKQPLILLPSCASWFDIENINDIEKKALPEYFCGKFFSKTPQIYKEYRNYMVRVYRANPHVYLSVTACRRNLAGDVGGILRIHSFLDHWGIINFCADPQTKPHRMSLSRPEILDTKVLINTGGIRSERFTEPGIEQSLTATDAQSLIVSKNVNSLPKNKRPICDFCGEACGLIWFQHRSGIMRTTNVQELIERDPYSIYSIILCERCYEKGNYPRMMSKTDFELCSLKPDREIKTEWTKEETLILLKVIKRYKNNWNEIMKELKSQGITKSKEDCIMKFMSIPMNEYKEAELMADNPGIAQLKLIAKTLEQYANEDTSHIKKPNKLLKSEDPRVKELTRRERKEIRRLMDLLLLAQIKKLETKISFFNEFDSLIQNERQQIKALQGQIFTEKVNMSMNKSDLTGQSIKHKSFDITMKEPDIKVNKPSDNN